MEDSTFLRHEPCPKCGSKDNLGRYSDGHASCFSYDCDYYEPGEGQAVKEQEERSPKKTSMLTCEPAVALPSRKLTEETCKLFGYRPSTHGKAPCQVANYIKDGKLVAQHVRKPDKKFLWKGNKKNLPLFGQWLWKAGGKKLVITEGQIDAMSVSQLQNNKWPVVSINSGCKGAPQDIRDNIEFVDSFDTVVFMFDMDEPGQDAAIECAKLLSPGKAAIAHLPLKDANECLKQGRGKEVLEAMWGAKEYRPDGIISVDDIEIDELLAEAEPGYEIPYGVLQEKYRGLRPGELVLITAGSGIGKSTLAREIQYHLGTHHGLKTGAVYLEENYKKTFKGMVAIDHNIPLGDLIQNPKILKPEQYQETKDKFSGKLFLYDHFGSLESDSLLDKMTYLRVGLGCEFIVLDHISMVVSDQEGSGEGERKDIDRLMTKLRSFIERTGVGIIAIVHLKRPQGGRKSFNQGGQISLQDLRGSASLEQLSDAIWALERDQQCGDDSNLAHIRGLKNRMFGDLGSCGYAEYNKQTGRFLPAAAPKKKESKDYGFEQPDEF